MRPSVGKILEVGWCSNQGGLTTHIVHQNEEIPRRITEITGIGNHDLVHGIQEREMFDQLFSEIKKYKFITFHYAQFEKSFLVDLFMRYEHDLCTPVICSHKIAKRIYPGLPSKNIRAMAGFFGSPIFEFKRSKDHVEATKHIWSLLVDKLSELDICTVEGLQNWLNEKPTKKQVTYEYRASRDLRLRLTSSPGVYRMLSKDGRILYVGKATRLKDRVNSYFRGRRGRDPRKLELMAQVWNVEVSECHSPLEAALLETDEIKKWRPPYNVSLQANDRRLVFYSRDFLSSGDSHNPIHCFGPFRQNDVLESVIHFANGNLAEIFYEPIDSLVLNEGYRLFCDKYGLKGPVSVRSILSLALKMFRAFHRLYPQRDLEDVFAEQKAARTDEVTLQAEDIAAKFERLFLRSARSLRRSRTIHRLRNSTVYLNNRALVFRGGQLNGKEVNRKWSGDVIAEFDRMSVLLSEIQKRGFEVQFQ